MPAQATATKIRKPAQAMKSRRPLWRTLLEGLLSLAVIIAVLEWFLPVCGVGQEEFLQPDLKLGCRHIPGKYVVWRMEGFSQGNLNSAGLRDVERSVAKQPGVTRIAVLGDSSTEGLQVALDETYTRRLEKLLNETGKGKYEVINFACSSYSTAQQYTQFVNEVTAYKPDITVLLYNRGDAIENVRKPYKLNVEPRPYFYLDQAGNLQLDEAVLKAQEAKLRPNPLMDFLRGHSSIYGVFSQTNLALSINEPLYGRLKSWFDGAVNFLANANKPKVATPTYTEQNAFDVTRKLISRLHEVCTQNNSRFVLLVFPNTMGDLDLAFQSKQLLAAGKEEGFDCLDLTPAFYATKKPGSLFLEFHFSAPGHKVVADELAKLLSK